MKRNRRFTALLLGLGLGLAGSARAQDEGPGPGFMPGPPPIADMLREPLGLSDEQVAKLEKVDAALRESFEKARADMENDGFDPERMRDHMEANRAKMDAALGEILTDEQKAKLADLGPPGMGGPRGMGPGGGRRDRNDVEALEKELTLPAADRTVVLDLVKKLEALRREADRNAAVRRDGLRGLIGKGAPAGEVGERLRSDRQAAQSDRARVEKAQAELKAKLPIEDETWLVVRGILD